MANQFTLKNGGYEPFIGNFGLVPQPPIPEPAAEDNGKVLGVSDGSYALVNGGGGGGGTVEPLIVNIIGDENDSYLDKTWNEIKAVVDAGGVVYLKMTMGDDYILQLIGGIGTMSGAYAVAISAITYASTTADGVLTLQK